MMMDTRSDVVDVVDDDVDRLLLLLLVMVKMKRWRMEHK